MALKFIPGQQTDENTRATEAKGAKTLRFPRSMDPKPVADHAPKQPARNKAILAVERNRRNKDPERVVLERKPKIDELTLSSSIKFNASEIVERVSSFLKRQADGMSKQDIAALEVRLQAEIAKVLRSRSWRY